MQGNNTEKFVATLATPFQSLELVLQQLLVERSIDTAIGAQLDIIGKIVGQPRNGLDDDTYRRYCRARIAANKSDGTVENLITVTDLVIYDDDGYYEIKTQGIATVVVKINNIILTEELAGIVIGFLKETVSGGVRVILEYASDLNCFKWDTAGRGWDSGAPFLTAED